VKERYLLKEDADVMTKALEKTRKEFPAEK
jgi:hypothetical protein